MPDIGRFAGQDRFTEVMPDWTPYRFAFNNPIYFSDPTGLFEDSSSNIIATCPNCPKTSTYQPFIDDPNTEYFYDSETGKVTKVGQIEEVTVTGKKKEQQQQNIDYHYWSQFLRKTSGYAFSANKLLFQPAFERAVLYGNPQNYSTTNIVLEKSLPKILGGKRIIYQPIMEMNAIKAEKWAKGTKIAGRVFGGAGLVLGGIDMYQNGITTSNTLDVTMSALALSPTGVGQGVAAVYFLANGITTLTTGKDIGQHLDANGYNLGELINEQIK